MMRELQVPVTDEIEAFVVNQLVKDKELIAMIRASPNADSLLAGTSPDDISDLEIVRLLVSAYVKSHAVDEK